jgi:hypothetical protein
VSRSGPRNGVVSIGGQPPRLGRLPWSGFKRGPKSIGRTRQKNHRLSRCQLGFPADRRALELEVVEVLGERQLGDGELVFDRARLLLADLGVEYITDDALGLMLAFDSSGPCLADDSDLRF